MVCKSYVAVTPKEIQNASGQALAWMSCRFDPKGKGLTNLPEQLPKGSLILVDDLHPICGHEPNLVTRQLKQLCQRLQPCGIVLDLQRPKSTAACNMVRAIAQIKNVAVSEEYARELDCPVFLTAPMGKKLPGLLTPWKGQEIWLDVPMGQGIMHQGRFTAQQGTALCTWQWDRFLCCGYAKAGENAYTLCRNKAMLPRLLEEAARLGVTKVLVLYSEL